MDASHPIKFRHFIPKDEDLKFFIAPESVGSADLLKAVEKEFAQQTERAKESLSGITKAPSEPNWDLKRHFAKRNKKFENQTLRAIAELAGKSAGSMEVEEPDADDVFEVPGQMVADEQAGQVRDEVSDDEDSDEYAKARHEMAGLSKADIDPNEDNTVLE